MRGEESVKKIVVIDGQGGAAAAEILSNGAGLRLSSGFQFYQNEVYLLVYSQQEALLAGQLPSFFTGIQEPFQNGVTRSVATGQGVKNIGKICQKQLLLNS